jgi:hypothetical protein
LESEAYGVEKEGAGYMNPKHPVYIISKSRWESRKTVITLEEMKVPYHIVIEPQEYDQYAAVVDPAKILLLPFSNLGKGSIPARNWVWEHSIEQGAKWHWILDDNIRYFYRYNHNMIVPVNSGNIFRAAEDFVERYENVGQAGFNYFMFVARKDPSPAYYFNTRIYSCILNRNDVGYRWRGRYNEDTDLSIRILKDWDKNWCTILFNAFLAGKTPTMTMAGGNSDELYKDDGRLQMAQSLVDQHPDMVKIVWKFGRWQHSVDYSLFKKKRLIKKVNDDMMPKVNNFGMIYQEKIGSDWETKIHGQPEANP